MSAEPSQIITAAEAKQAQQNRVSLISKMANKYGLEPEKMMATLKATAFRGDVSNEQMAALLIVADKHNLNPWLKEIYAFPSRQGIVPIVGVDGWARIINEHPQFDGMDFKLEGETGKEAYTCTIYRKDRKHPVTVTEYMTECYRKTDPWQTHPLRMLRHKAMIQCARLAFSFAGIYDPDEGERILAAEDAIDITPPKPALTLDDDGKPVFLNADGTEHVPGKKIGPKKLREIIEGIESAVKVGDAAKLYEVYGTLDNEQKLFAWGHLHSWIKTAAKTLMASSAYKMAETGLDVPAWSIETLRAQKNAAALESAWTAVQELYADHDQEVPLDIETVYHDRKAELGA